MKPDALNEMLSVYKTTLTDLNSVTAKTDSALSRSKKSPHKKVAGILSGLAGVLLSLSVHLFFYKLSGNTVFLLWAIRNSLLLCLLLMGLVYLIGEVAEKRADAGLKKALCDFWASELCIWQKTYESISKITIPEEAISVDVDPCQVDYYERIFGMYLWLDEQCEKSRKGYKVKPEEQEETEEDKKEANLSMPPKGIIAGILLLLGLSIYLCYDLVFGYLLNQYFDIAFLLIIPFLLGLLLAILLWKEYSYESIETLREHFMNIKELLEKVQKDLDELDSFYKGRSKDALSQRAPGTSKSEPVEMPDPV